MTLAGSEPDGSRTPSTATATPPATEGYLFVPATHTPLLVGDVRTA